MRCFIASVLLVICISGCAENGSYSSSSEAGSTFAVAPVSVPEFVTDEPATQIADNIPEATSVVPTKKPIGVSDPASDENAKASTTPVEYPENKEVERLIILAGELQQKGQFEKALALVNRALQLDPTSPSASSLKASLEDLLRKS